MLATRIARRLFPDGWPTYSGEEEGEEARLQDREIVARRCDQACWESGHCTGACDEAPEGRKAAQGPAEEAPPASPGAPTPQPAEAPEPPSSLAEAARQVRERSEADRRRARRKGDR
jgi:hypothetical protein